jgi:hypothetical protein|tara:strand:- start:82 stop:273 length:192 start_codon:yes stop_codon:yes gene_type:complete
MAKTYVSSYQGEKVKKGNGVQTIYSGSENSTINLRKKKKNKQSAGFFDMAVTYLTKKVKEITD